MLTWSYKSQKIINTYLKYIDRVIAGGLFYIDKGKNRENKEDFKVLFFLPTNTKETDLFV